MEAALAASNTTGTIQSLDSHAKTVTLIEGPTFHLPVGYDLAPFHVGEKVRLNWEEKGALKEALAMTAL